MGACEQTQLQRLIIVTNVIVRNQSVLYVSLIEKIVSTLCSVRLRNNQRPPYREAEDKVCKRDAHTCDSGRRFAEVDVRARRWRWHALRNAPAVRNCVPLLQHNAPRVSSMQRKMMTQRTDRDNGSRAGNKSVDAGEAEPESRHEPLRVRARILVVDRATEILARETYLHIYMLHIHMCVCMCMRGCVYLSSTSYAEIALNIKWEKESEFFFVCTLATTNSRVCEMCILEKDRRAQGRRQISGIGRDFKIV